MDGLNEKDIEYRVNNHLVNNEDIKNSRSLKEIVLSNTITLFNVIHLVLFVLVLTTGSIKNATFIFSILINTFISIYQEIKAKIIVDKLKIATVSKINVIRNGKKTSILPEEIVLDDLLYLNQGDSLIVDAKIVKSSNLEVDESIITGESDSILKKENDMVISGSIVTCGTGYAKVTSINKDTYANNLIKEASKTVDDSSYLMKNINAILKVVTFLIIPVGVLLFITQFFHSGQSYSESILSSVAGIIGMIPDGLVLLTSISLTVGVIKMASKKVIIQKLSGIELLACVDTLCLDKTGTITDGSMTVIDCIDLQKNKYPIKDLISSMNASLEETNSTAQALEKYFGKSNIYTPKEIIPFSSDRKYSAVRFDKGLFMLGAPEFVLKSNFEKYETLVNENANKGYRVLCLAVSDEETKSGRSSKTIKPIAFILIEDQIREDAFDTIRYFRESGVEVKVISGDNPVTVSEVAKRVAIAGAEDYISLDGLSDEDVYNIADKYTVFGRVKPNQKQIIVKALKAKGKTVAMTEIGRAHV